ncbi:MAG: hypothetical protein M3O31_10705 [Acidobacteriota bacterium]|nr:hypothetical protein [Acidobacteriota bacterium]
MQRKPNLRPHSNSLVAAFLLLSAAISIVLLAVRNLSDDEISSLNTITSPVASILRLIAVTDAHPPGMYLLGHFAFRILPSFRWMNLFSAAVLYAGLAVFLLQVTPLLARTGSRIVLLLLATLHPQLLMWSVTYRWYGWWTGLALIALTVALQPLRPRPAFSLARAVLLGVLLAGLFYLNFITFLFAFALPAAMLLRYRTEPRTKLAASAFTTTAIFLALAAPQFPAMIAIHLPYGQSQRSGILNSTLHLIQSIAASEAYLPWHPLAIAADLLLAALCLCGLLALLRRLRSPRISATSAGAFAPILLFSLLFFVLVAASGLGGRPRNGLLLVVVLAPAAALITDTLNQRTQSAILIFFACWSSVGIAHLAGRYGLSKASMISRPEQVVAFVHQTSGTNCSVIITYEPMLAFTVTQANLPHTVVVSPFHEPVLGGSHDLPESDCTHAYLYTVQSYLADGDDAKQAVQQQLQSATHFIDGPPRTDSFSFDPDAARKRTLARIPGLASAATLPDYRYVVISGPIDPARISPMRQAMPDYSSGHITVKDSPLKP